MPSILNKDYDNDRLIATFERLVSKTEKKIKTYNLPQDIIKLEIYKEILKELK